MESYTKDDDIRALNALARDAGIVGESDDPRCRVRRLLCNCCGGVAGQYRQHSNQDDGWGICRSCLDRHYIGKGYDAETIASYFGTEGVNYARA